MVSLLSEHECFLHEDGTGWSFTAVVCKDPNVSATCDRVSSTAQLLAEELQVLNDLGHRPQLVTPRMDHTREQVEMSFNSPFHKMMRIMITFDVDRIVEAKLKTKHTQVTEEALKQI